VMARQVGPQERKPDCVLVLEVRATDENVPSKFHQSTQALPATCRIQACNQSLVETSQRHHLANRSVFI
jgi:hypothetical protein